MGSNEEEEDTIAVTLNKPFSIRDYVRTAREKDITSNWPFPEEYLQACLKHGISKLLPPFESHTSVRNPLYREEESSGCVKDDKARVVSSLTNCIEINEKEEIVEICNGLISIDEAISEVSKSVCVLSLSADRYECGEEESGLNSDIQPMALKVCPSKTKPSSEYHMDQCLAEMPSTKKLKCKRKRRRGKPKAKKRLMVDIFAKARPCTLEELDKICESNRFINQSSVPGICDQQFADEVNGSISVADGDCEPKSVMRFWKTKHPRYDIADNDNAVVKKRSILKFKFNGHITNESKSNENSDSKLQGKWSSTTDSDNQPALQR